MVMAAAETFQEIHEIGEYNAILSTILVITFIVLVVVGIQKIKEVFGFKTKDELYKQEIEKRLKDIDDRLNRHSDKISHMETKIHNFDKKMDEFADSFYEKQKKYHDQSITIRGELREEQKEIKTSVLELKDLIIKKDINDMRWEILDFANAVMSGRDYNKEQYDHVLETYEDYEKILKDNNMENGKVDLSMGFIKKQYGDLMVNGFKR